MNIRSSISAKKVAATMAAIMLGVHTQGAIHSVSAASVVVTETASEAGSGQSSIVLDSKLPKGAKISSEKAYNNVIALFPELKKATLTSSNFGGGNSYPQPNYKVWDLQFQIRMGSSSHGFSATVHGETGEVLSVYLPEYLWEKQAESDAKRISYAESEAISKAFLHKAIKGLSEDDYVKLDANGGDTISPLFGHAQYYFVYQLHVNGLPTSENTVYVTVHDSGVVTNYSRNIPQSDFPSPNPKLSAEEARSIFEKNFNVELSYIPNKYSYNKKHSNYYLGYLPSTGMESIDANTGETFSAYNSTDTKTEYVTESLPNGNAFVPSKKDLSAEEALQLVENTFPTPKGYQVSESRYEKRSYRSGEPSWNIRWSKEDKDNSYMYMNGISAEVNAKTGEIHSYEIYNHSMDNETEVDKTVENKQKITAEAAKKLAINKVLTLVPNAAKELKLSTVSNSDTNYFFNFTRYLNGVPVYGDNVSISMDKTGAVQSFYSQFSADAANMPAASEPAVTKEAAKKIFLDRTKTTLQYEGFGGYYGIQGNREERSIKLVYHPQLSDIDYYSNEALDASSGKWKLLYGTTQESIVSDIVDIKGHSAESVLQKMATHGVLTPNEEGKIEPERTITKGDWYTYLARGLNPGVGNDVYYSGNEDDKIFADVDTDSPYASIMNLLINQSWIEADPEQKISPEKQLTRGELAEMIMSVLKYEKLSKFYQQGTDLAAVADASQITNKGAASLAIKLDLLPLIDGRFLPERYVTVAEAAQVLNRLAELQGKLDFFMNSQSSYRYY